MFTRSSTTTRGWRVSAWRFAPCLLVAAIVIGSIVGSAMLALGGAAGASTGVPTMVLFDVMCTYAAPGVSTISSPRGMRVNCSAFVVAATSTEPPREPPASRAAPQPVAQLFFAGHLLLGQRNAVASQVQAMLPFLAGRLDVLERDVAVDDGRVAVEPTARHVRLGRVEDLAHVPTLLR